MAQNLLADPAPFFLAFVFGVHIAMVNLGIALSTLIPVLKWRGDRGSETDARVARSLMRFYAYTYAVAGVFGTAFTVFLLSYYPVFLALAGHITLIPFGLSILFIVLHFFSIVAYWYGWDRWSPATHTVIGVLMAVSAYLIPFGFRAVFAFLNTPQGLVLDSKPGLDVAAALANPTFAPLYLKSVVGALTAGLLVVAGGYAYKLLREPGDEAAEYMVRRSTAWASLGLLAMFALGFWYAMSLLPVEYKFNNIFGGLGWLVGDGRIAYNYSWLFLLKMLFVAVQGLAVFYVLYGLLVSKSFPAPGQLKALVAAGFSSLATIVAGEYLNAFSQYPYFVAELADPKLVAAIPEKWRAVLAGALVMKANPLATGFDLLAITAVALGVLLVAMIFLIYLVLAPEQRR